MAAGDQAVVELDGGGLQHRLGERLLDLHEADRVQTRNLGRGYGGLIGNELSMRVAPQLGVSQATVRRNASRSVRALAQAAGRFGHDE